MHRHSHPRRAARTASAARRSLVFLAAAIGAAACGRGEGAPSKRGARAHAARAARHAPALPPYRVIAVPDGGTILGRVTAASPTPSDTSVAITRDQDVCGPSQLVPLVERRGDRLEDVVVWLDGIRAGKPLPVERRFEVQQFRCAILPRVQAAIAGGMLDVRSADPIVHRTTFVRDDDDTLDTVQETDAGQVVPTAKVLAEPGLVTARCAFHPISQAWIRVFDQPYYAVTNRDGTFTIDSVPPGHYTLHAWQPRLGERSVPVDVRRGAEVKADVRY